MPQPLLLIDNLHKKYNRQPALNGVSLSVAAGEILGFIGPNGAGKTTTIKIAAGLAFADSGTVTVAGHVMNRGPASTKAAKSALGLLPDRPYLYEKLTCREYLFFIAGLYRVPRAAAARHLDEMSARFRMGDYVDRPIDSMSHGMKQKTALAGALVHQPPVFICDEPLVGLDPHGAKEFKTLLGDLRKAGRAVLMSSHTLDLVEQACDRVVILGRGEKLAEGTVPEIKAKAHSDATLEELFLQMTEEETSAGPGAK